MKLTNTVTTTLLAMMLLSAAVLPIETPAQEKPLPPPRTEEQTSTATSPQAKPAPKLGHPLDPADVDVLTGKNKPNAGASRPVEVLPYGDTGYTGYGRFGYSMGASRFGGSQFAPVGGSAQPLFAPIAFGRVGNRSFFIVGNTGSFGAPFFFFSRGRAQHIGLFPLTGSRFSARWR